MTGLEIAMDTQVTTTLLSGGVAVFVALLGIGGAVVAQLLATRRAFSNSLAMFEQQRRAELEDRVQERAEAARQEELQRFADERRLTYAKYLRLVDELWKCRLVGADPSQETSDQYAELRTQIDLLASEPVRAAAAQLFDATVPLIRQDHSQARATFVDAARRELGMPPHSDTQRPGRLGS